MKTNLANISDKLDAQEREIEAAHKLLSQSGLVPRYSKDLQRDLSLDERLCDLLNGYHCGPIHSPRLWMAFGAALATMTIGGALMILDLFTKWNQ